jgi:Ger(x)C family germination protein
MVYIIGEERARFGILDILDSVIRDNEGNKKAFVTVSGPKAKDILSITEHPTATVSETISGIMKYAYQDNFFSTKLTIGSFLTMYHQEGRKIVLPYISTNEERTVEIQGLALFKEDKMLYKANLDETRLINLLRNNKVRGHLNVETEDQEKYIELLCTNKLKVKVSKEEERLKYDIFVTLAGNLKLDTVNNNTSTVNAEDLAKIKKMFQEKFQKELTAEVKKLQQDYGVDWIDLGKYAVAKYGRGKGYGSDENFQKAKIDIHVDVKLISTGSTT